MSREEARELLPLYALNALSEGERKAVEEALARYPELVEELRAYQEGVLPLLEADPIPPSPGLEARVLARVRRRGYLRALPSFLLRAAAVLALLFLGYGAYLGYAWGRALADPGTRVLTLESPQGEVVGRVVVRKDRAALVLLNRLPPQGRVFQAWGLVGGRPEPLPTFRLPAKVLRLPPEAEALAVSLEPPGGSSRPTQILGLPR